MSSTATPSSTSRNNVKKIKTNTMPVKNLSLEGDLSNNWSLWYQQFKTFMEANGFDKQSNSCKVAKFLLYVGIEALSIFNSFNMDVNTCKYEDLVKRFEQYCNWSKKKLIVERHNFFIRIQKPEETIDDFVTALHILSLSCEFGLLRKSLVRDMLIKGLKSSNVAIKEKLLQEDNVPLEKAVQIAKNMEKNQQLQIEDELIYIIDGESIEESNQKSNPTVHSDYSENREVSLLREILIRDTSTKRLLREDNLSLEKAVHIAKSIEEGPKEDQQLENKENEFIYIIDAESIQESNQKSSPIVHSDNKKSKEHPGCLTLTNQQQLVLSNDVSGATNTQLPIIIQKDRDTEVKSEENRTEEEEDQLLQNKENELLFYVIYPESIQEFSQKPSPSAYSTSTYQQKPFLSDGIGMESEEKSPKQEQDLQLQNTENELVVYIIDAESVEELSIDTKDISEVTDTKLPVIIKEEIEIKVESEETLNKPKKPLQCYICRHKCTDKDSLKAHLRRHQGEKKPFRCTICNQSYTAKRTLRSHMFIHAGEKPFKCELCNYRCRVKSNLDRHQRLHTGEKPFKCNLCDYRCLMKSSLKLHMYIHTGLKPLQCNICDYKCVQKSELKRHMFIHSGDKPFQCNHCDYKGADVTRYKEHMYIHIGKKPYQCDVCSYSSARKLDLQIHMRIHTGEKPFQCDLCDYKAVRKESLLNHMQVHNKGISYQCETCDFKTLSNGKLKIHMRVHAGKEPFQCDSCNFKCAQKITLNRHRQIAHSEEKRFQCHICGCRMKMKCNLRKHLLIHGDEKPYQCHVCGYRTRMNRNLRAHMRVHTGEKPFQCHICGHKSRTKTALESHIRTHTGEKPFECHVCGYKCNRRANLQTHIRTHTGEKPYECSLCDYKCVYSKYLKRHMSVHSKA